MEPNKFDEIIKRATDTRLTRLEALRGLAAGAAAAVTGAAIASSDADAKNKGKSAKKGKKGKSSKGGKVEICHGSGSASNPYVTIEVSQKAVKAHLRHGDSLGACPGTSTTQAPSTSTTQAPATTTTTQKYCKPDGYDCKGDCENKCCSHCGDDKGKCAPCPTTTTTTTTTTTEAPVTTTTTTTAKPCIENGKYSNKDEKCCSGCRDGKGYCKVCKS